MYTKRVAGKLNHLAMAYLLRNICPKNIGIRQLPLKLSSKVGYYTFFATQCVGPIGAGAAVMTAVRPTIDAKCPCQLHSYSCRNLSRNSRIALLPRVSNIDVKRG